MALIEIVTLLKEFMLNDHDDGASRASADASALQVCGGADEHAGLASPARDDHGHDDHHHGGDYAHVLFLHAHARAHVGPGTPVPANPSRLCLRLPESGL